MPSDDKVVKCGWTDGNSGCRGGGGGVGLIVQTYIYFCSREVSFVHRFQRTTSHITMNTFLLKCLLLSAVLAATRGKPSFLLGLFIYLFVCLFLVH